MSIHVFAEGIHTGGGLVILEDLLCTENKIKMCGYVHHKVYKEIKERTKSEIVQLDKNYIMRYIQIIRICRSIKRKDKVIWMNSIRGRRNKGKNIVYAQNRLLYGNIIDLWKSQASIKSYIKWLLCKLQKSNNTIYYVQTEEMMELLKDQGIKKVKVVPFYRRERTEIDAANTKYEFDFIYPADGVKHKNHKLHLLFLEFL